AVKYEISICGQCGGIVCRGRRYARLIHLNQLSKRVVKFLSLPSCGVSECGGVPGIAGLKAVLGNTGCQCGWRALSGASERIISKGCVNWRIRWPISVTRLCDPSERI